MARAWEAPAARLSVELPPAPHRPFELVPGVEDGQWVAGRVLGWEGRTAPGEDVPVLPNSRMLVGILTLTYSELTGTWRASVDGQSADPRSLQRVAQPAD